MDASGGERLLLKLVGQLERAARRTRRGLLRLLGRREPKQERAPELVVVPFLRLDHVTVHGGRLAVAGALAELDELPVLHDRDRLAGELAGRHPLDGGLERVEVLKQRSVALR